MAKIISVDPKEKYYAVKIEFFKDDVVDPYRTSTSPIEEYKVWKSDFPAFNGNLKPNTEVDLIMSTKGKYGLVLDGFKVIKEGRLGLSEKQKNSIILEITARLHDINCGDSDYFIKKQAELLKELINRAGGESLRNAPAAKTHHHNYVGGLLQHTYEVLQNVPQDNSLAVMGAILHDFGKIWEYKIDVETGIIEYNDEFRKELMLPERSNVYPHILWGYNWCIERGFKELAHIVGSHHNKPEWGSLFSPVTPEAHMVFIADYKSSHLGAITVADLPE